MQNRLGLLAYLSAPILAEKCALLNMAIEPATTALALLRACSQQKHIDVSIECNSAGQACSI